MTTILVTGATGTIGSRVVSALAGKPGVSVRVATRDVSKAAGQRAANVTPVAFDWENPDAIAAAVKGADKVFLLTPMSDTQVAQAKRLIDASKAAGVKHVVKLSVTGAEQEPGIMLGRWHREAEKLIQASGIPYTFLRPGFFADNTIHYYPPDAEGAIYLPFGDGAVSWIDARDIGDVAAAVLTTPGHEGKAYDLTGPAALTMTQVAEELSKASGRKIRYVDVPESAAKGAMEGMGMRAWAVQGMLELHAVCKAGWAGGVATGVKDVLGREPRSFAEFARDNAAAWRAK